MDTRKYIGFYVNHHGTGHLTRTLEIVRHLSTPVKILCSRDQPSNLPENVEYVHLPMDIDDAAATGETPDFLHYAATGSPAIADRMGKIAQACRDVRLLVVDVSVEVTLLARLLSIPTFVTLMHGERDDMPHLMAYRSAEALLATYPAALEQPERPLWIKNKTRYFGIASKLSGRKKYSTTEARKIIGVSNQMVLVMSSLGGNGVSLDVVAKLAEAAPTYTWVVAGVVNTQLNELPENLIHVGVQDDVWPYLCAADIVIGSGGNNTIAEIATANKPAILVPEPRPFNEQYCNIRSLKDAGIVTMYPELSDILHQPVEVVLGDVRARPLRWAEVLDRDAPKKQANYIMQQYARLVW